ncbi:MAG: long-chain fatty acid--CoA ligase [Glaciimonas sp.]|nr:long-chain fatty acid--CoA ligase [Glaciimonas sp.]
MDQNDDLPGLPRRIHDAFLPWVEKNSSRIALTDANTSLTYGEMPAVVDAVAARFRDAGVRGGDRVLLVAENSVALAVCILAISRLDAWSATVNARLSIREIDNFLSHSGARVAIYFNQVSAEAGAHGLAHGAQPVQWPGIGEIMLGPVNQDTTPEPIEDDAVLQVAVMVYTSGTTGSPKAVMLTHRNLLFIGANSRSLRRLMPTDTVYGVLPLSHVYGLSALLVASLIGGATLRLVPRFLASDLARALAQEGVTVLHGVPAMFAKLIEWNNRAGTCLQAPHLRVVQSGGAPLTLPVKEGFEKIFGLVLQNGYGMTEAAPSICQTRIDAPRRDCSVGPVIPGVEVSLHGVESDPAGIGELWVRGPNVMKGYYRAPELTAEAVTEEGWLRTGNLARIESDGAIFIVGRSKELIIRSGFNVYPIEVEQVLNAYPGVVHSAVVGREVVGNEEVVAFIEAAQGTDIDIDALNAYCRDNLSSYKIPSEIVVLDYLPATATGKVLKKELQQRAAAKTSTTHGHS